MLTLLLLVQRLGKVNKGCIIVIFLITTIAIEGLVIIVCSKFGEIQYNYVSE